MADAATRRKLRRNRILENSAARLQRITGQTSTKPPLEDAPILKLSSTINGTIPNESVIDSWKILSEFQDEFPPTSQGSLSNTNLLNKLHVPRRRNLEYTSNGNSEAHAHEHSFTLDQQPSFSAYAETTSKETKALKDSSLITLLSSQWIYVVLAFLVNIMIVLKGQHIFGTSIIVPFSIMIITRIFFCGSPQHSQSGSMLFAALILCNIKPEIIHRLRTPSSLLCTVCRELSFYLFSFVLIYYLFTSYQQDFEYLASNNIEIVLNHQTDI
ncbi:uncharacterized protein [Fopius arisanus]|uniref:Uncharacterized protein isoform X1 n=1 Tax=Fopius arisanus TaxID=64838 RepID=A0A9R1U993_9HYME|nr:PREDICTED: uncharacterized protein LOC105271750 isoform X1 [Fopius arisanus]